jgi:hypothetical protein
MQKLEWKESDAEWEVRKPSYRAESSGVKLHVCLDFDQETWAASACLVGGYHGAKASFDHKTISAARDAAQLLGQELIDAEILRFVRLREKFTP